MSDRRDQTSQGRTLLLVAGGAFVAWLLLHGRGWGLGRGLAGLSGKGGRGRPPVGPPCRVRLTETGIELDGGPADLATTISRCREAGRAEVTATGAAITGAIAQVLRELRCAGVVIHASPDLLDLPGTADDKRCSS